MPCQNGATCTNTDGSYACICPEGWTGPNCARDINECQELQCLNGGTCINTPGSYTCLCDIGWTGDTCNIGEDTFEISEKYQKIRPSYLFVCLV